MNRIRLEGALSGISFGGESEGGESHGAPHACFVPLHCEPRYAYPLVVWLHGAGGSERQLQRIMPLMSLRNYVAVAPRGPTSLRDGFTWQQTAGDIEAAEDRVFDAIAHACERQRVNVGRVFLAGRQEGGTMALRLAFRYPERFAGVVSLGGPLPLGGRPLASFDRLRSLPVLLAAGRQSADYDEDRVCEDLRLLHTAGGAVTVRQYPCGDDLSTHMLEDANRWMMEIVTGAFDSGEFNEAAASEEAAS